MNQKEIASKRKASIAAAITALGDKLDTAKDILKKNFEQESEAVLTLDFRQKYSVYIDWDPIEESIVSLQDLSARIVVEDDKVFRVYRLDDYYGKLGWMIVYKEERNFMAQQMCCSYGELQDRLEELISTPWI